VTIALAGCTNEQDKAPTSPDTPKLSLGAAAPAPLVDISLGGGKTVKVWPYTSSKLEVAPSDNDPINVVFTGETDPRALRAALMALPATRGAPFDFVTCAWTDALGGDIQGTYIEPDGWEGSAIQLACGAYGPMPRFHLRFFAGANVILGGAHFEIQVPGTSDHQVLNWELAEQLVVYDMVRTGLVNPAELALTGPINGSPWRTVPDYIYNPIHEAADLGDPAYAALLQAIWFPATSGPATGPFPISNSGQATLIPVNAHYAGPMMGSTDEYTVEFDQGIPKPFCASEEPFVWVQGPVLLTQTVTVGPNGRLMSAYKAQGQLQVVPINPANGEPTAPAYSANIVQRQRTTVTNQMNSSESFFQQQLRSANPAERGFQLQQLWVGSEGPDHFKEVTQCGTGN